jgi:hypothetical protein
MLVGHMVHWVLVLLEVLRLPIKCPILLWRTLCRPC